MSDQEQEPELPGEPEEQEDVEVNEEANDGKLALVFTLSDVSSYVYQYRINILTTFLHTYLYLITEEEVAPDEDDEEDEEDDSDDDGECMYHHHIINK